MSGGPRWLPPYANRGVVTGFPALHGTPDEFVSPWGTLVSCGVDWLSLTVATHAARPLLDQSEFVEDGHARPGFKESERRAAATCMGGGVVWRRKSPRQASKAFGVEYESWELSGPEAHWFALLAGSEVGPDSSYPTRMDFCWDFVCVPELLPSDVTECVREHVEVRGYSVGHYGDVVLGTREIGSRESARYLCIYRRDFKHGGPPVMRVELRVREKVLTIPLWRAWCCDPVEGVAAAAAMVEEMIGQCVQPLGRLPDRDEMPKAAVVAQLAASLRQYGAAWRDARACGVDLHALLESIVPPGRMAESRSRLRRKELGVLGADEVTARVRSLLETD